MDRESESEGGERRTRWYHVVLLGVIAVAFVGFFVGTRERGFDGQRGLEGVSVPKKGDDRDRSGRAPRAAPTYGELLESPYAANRSWLRAIEHHRDESPDDQRPEENPRSHNRAYDGAPPTVPHPVRQRSPEACAACHQKGVRVGERDGPPMSHDFMVNCIQCHTSSSPDRPFGSEPPPTVTTRNRFEGRDAPDRGPRAYAGAPPRIPHRTQLRSKCSSCHGKFGRPGPPGHGPKAACRQCHADPSGPHVAGAAPPSVPAGNRFDGLDAGPADGQRVWAGAPPQIPHQTHMRENCLSCHGPPGEAAVEKTSHPWRRQCVQCHAPTGRFDFRPPTNRRPFAVPGGQR
ncbi:MAG: hypothetical protein ABEL76_10665 [Bradymonadaceae bacterium]